MGNSIGKTVFIKLTVICLPTHYPFRTAHLIVFISLSSLPMLIKLETAACGSKNCFKKEKGTFPKMIVPNGGKGDHYSYLFTE